MSAVMSTSAAAATQPLIRPMREDDLDAVIGLETACYDFPWTRGIFADCLAANYSCWVMMADDQLVGYAVLGVGAGEAHILNICINNAWRRAGCGYRMLSRLVDLARWHHAEKIFLEVRPSNYAAVAMYQRYGFSIVGRRPNYYPDHEGREDALIMSFPLRSKESSAVAD